LGIAISFIALDCKRYQNGHGMETMSAVIGPRRVIDDVTADGKQVQIIFNACSNYQSCVNPICGYSSYFRKIEKGKE
jgi:hypothetical protein